LADIPRYVYNNHPPERSKRGVDEQPSQEVKD
jgi:hypothetical protein